jgi:hypothetical protein
MQWKSPISNANYSRMDHNQQIQIELELNPTYTIFRSVNGELRLRLHEVPSKKEELFAIATKYFGFKVDGLNKYTLQSGQLYIEQI